MRMTVQRFSAQRLLGCTAPAGHKAYARITRGQPKSPSVFNYINYTYSSAWVIAYRLPLVVRPLQDSARVHYAVGANR